MLSRKGKFVTYDAAKGYKPRPATLFEQTWYEMSDRRTANWYLAVMWTISCLIIATAVALIYFQVFPLEAWVIHVLVQVALIPPFLWWSAQPDVCGFQFLFTWLIVYPFMSIINWSVYGIELLVKMWFL